jgi:hypothetical protein
MRHVKYLVVSVLLSFCWTSLLVFVYTSTSSNPWSLVAWLSWGAMALVVWAVLELRFLVLAGWGCGE